MFEIVPHGFWIDFISKRRIFAIASAVGVAIGLGLFFIVGPNWGLDFSGGTEVQVRFGAATSIADVRGALAPMGIGDEAIQQLGKVSDNRFVVRLRGEDTGNTGSSRVEDARKALEGAFGSGWLETFVLDSEVGTTVRVAYRGDAVPLEKVEAVLAPVEGVKVTTGSEPNTLRLRLPGVAEDIRATLMTRLPQRAADIERADSVGPKVGGNLRHAGIVAVVLSIVIHVIYIALRFDLTFAPGAIVGLLHDVAITCGLLVLTRQEFGLQTVSALLTLTGYSLNDTIIIYDRIRENMGKFRRTRFGELVNTSVNETLGRTLMTSIATSMAMIPFLFIGGPVLREFAFVMLVGIVVGTYSSVYVAAPITMVLDENRDRIAAWFGFGGRPSTQRGAKSGTPPTETP